MNTHVQEMVPARLRGIVVRWSGPFLAEASRKLVTAGLALLFLHAAGTIEVTFTLRASYLLLIAACLVGAPHILDGWRRLPSWLRWLALGLVLSYVAALAFGHGTVLPGQGRGSSYRGAVYLFDLALGISIVGLIAGLWEGADALRPLLWALVIGASAAAAYGVYQWLALRFGLPLQDVNNAVNSDGVSYGGARSQGPGPLGGQRIRSTFVEPHFLATFLASIVPLALVLRPRGTARWAVRAALALTLFALVLTGSVPVIAVLITASLLGIVLLSVATGRAVLAAASGGLLVTGAIVAVLVAVDPTGLSSVTRRSAKELRGASAFRVDSWDRAVTIWSRRPVVGYGPGQAAVMLARREPDRGRSSRTPVVLGTANGVLTAALLDGGVLAVSFWVLALGGVLLVGGRALVRNGSALLAAIFVAATAAVLGSLIEGDRLELRVWALLGLLAAASGLPESYAHHRRG
jgi:hypothetical protein